MMEYMADREYEFVKRKYQDSKKPFNSMNRYIRHDEIFDTNSGMDPEWILSQIKKRDEKYKDLPHAVRKANACAFILDHTRILCDERDRFPAINCIDRMISKVLIIPWKNEVLSEKIPAENKRELDLLGRTGAATIWVDFDHSSPIWEQVFQYGFPGLLQEAKKAKQAHLNQGTLTEKQEGYFEGIFITYSAILRFLNRLEKIAYPRMAKALSHLATQPPNNVYEVLLTIYLYFMISEHIEGLQVRTLSNLDRLLLPYYQKDLENGVTEQEIRTDIAFFLYQFTAIGNYWNQPMYLGGTKKDGTSEINELSYLILDVYDKLGIYNPKIQIKLSKNTPEAFVKKALDMIRHGHNSIVFVCEETMKKALLKIGATEEQARLCHVTGCYEYSVQGEMYSGMNYLSLIKPLEFALHGGRDGITGELVSIETSPEFATFEELYETYFLHLKHLIDRSIRIVNSFEEYLDYINPQPILSPTFPKSLKLAVDPYAGGGISNGSTMQFGYLANVADSLTVIKKMIFEEKEMSLSEFVEILDKDWEGHELLRQKAESKYEKYGNNLSLPDQFAVEITSFVGNYVTGKPNAISRGGKWSVGLHVARRSYDDGYNTAASADGRRKRSELSKNASAAMGRNKSGATAAILSNTKIDATVFNGDTALDLGLHPSTVKGETGLNAMYSLLKTFDARGGHAIHFNVYDADTLRQAQKNPEKYADLQIRVCGWNVLFNHIAKKEQDEFIRQLEALI